MLSVIPNPMHFCVLSDFDAYNDLSLDSDALATTGKHKTSVICQYRIHIREASFRDDLQCCLWLRFMLMFKSIIK